MPGSFTDLGENLYQDHILGGQTKSTFQPYLGYFLTDSSETSQGTEPVGGGYARVAMTPDDWLTATNLVTQNVNDLACPRATATHGDVVGLGIFDSSVGGKCLVYFPAIDYEIIETRDSLIVLSGGLVHQFTDEGYSTLLKNAIFNDLYKAIPLPIYPTLWGAYCTGGSPTGAAFGTEPSGNAYSRIAIANNTSNFPPATGGTKSNGTTWEWPLSTGSQGTASHFGLFTASTGGVYLGRAPLNPPKTIAINDQLIVAAGDGTFTLD